jgi:hypothetical protein
MSLTKSARLALGRPQVFSLVVGFAYLALGALGFLATGPGEVTGFGDPLGETNGELLGFGLSPLHNVVHLIIGLLGVAMAWGRTSARVYGWLLFSGYGGAFVWGVLVAGGGANNPLNLNWQDNWLHLVTALVGLVIALVPHGVDRMLGAPRADAGLSR